jgi:hypothetical protein
MGRGELSVAVAMALTKDRRRGVRGKLIECGTCGRQFRRRNTTSQFCSLKCRPSPRNRLSEKDFWGRIQQETSIRAAHIGTPCWIYDGPMLPNGYGKFGNEYAHRYAYGLHHGSIPRRPLGVLHHCDVKSCCRPDHLYAGSQKRNAQDAVERLRLPDPERTRHSGESNGNAKLNTNDVEAIRHAFLHLPRTTVAESNQLRVRRGAMAALANEYDVCRQTIHRIIQKQHWTA